MDRTKLPASYLWPTWITLILAVWLFISPWILDVPQAGAWVWNVLVVGVIMAALSIMALSRLAE